jgi:hypothetical protein
MPVTVPLPCGVRGGRGRPWGSLGTQGAFDDQRWIWTG